MAATRAGKTSRRRRYAPGVSHQCPFCLQPFIGCRQKKYCSKSCLEAAFRVRKAALIDALTLHYAPYGLTRAHIERVVDRCLVRAQKLASVLALEYFERERVWETRANARVLYGVIYGHQGARG